MTSRAELLRPELLEIARSQPISPSRPPALTRDVLSSAAQDSATFEISRPKIPTPYALIHLQMKGHEIINEALRIEEANFEEESKRFKVLIEELNQVWQEHQEALASQESWSYFERIVSYVGSGLSIAMGASCITTGVGSSIGYILIAAGCMQIGNQVMSDNGGWAYIASKLSSDPEMKIKLSSGMEITCGSIATLASLIASFQATALFQMNTVAKTIASAVTTTQAIAESTSRIGEGIVTKKTLDAERNKTLSHAKHTELTSCVEKSMQEMISLCERESEFTEVLAFLLQGERNLYTIINQIGSKA